MLAIRKKQMLWISALVLAAAAAACAGFIWWSAAFAPLAVAARAVKNLLLSRDIPTVSWVAAESAGQIEDMEKAYAQIQEKWEKRFGGDMTARGMEIAVRNRYANCLLEYEEKSGLPVSIKRTAVKLLEHKDGVSYCGIDIEVDVGGETKEIYALANLVQEQRRWKIHYIQVELQSLMR